MSSCERYTSCGTPASMDLACSAMADNPHDFAGPFMGKSFLLVVDAHSKWPEGQEMKTITAAKTIEVLRQLFAAYGLPEQVVSDNGPQFTVEEFKDCMKVNGIKHIRSTPYHPSTNTKLHVCRFNCRW